ncbi:MAG: hypothetical protein LH618_07640 [Saprospiraceae bacterium]|nr:hypothetical protein [Saprospiraceae bacterium]
MLKLLSILLLLVACTPRNVIPVQEQPGTTFDQQSAEIQVFVCSRGCYQYLVKTNGVLYAPIGLPPEYQVNQSAFIFSGQLQSDSTMINKPGADDRLVPDFKVRNLKIRDIRPK